MNSARQGAATFLSPLNTARSATSLRRGVLACPRLSNNLCRSAAYEDGDRSVAAPWCP